MRNHLPRPMLVGTVTVIVSLAGCAHHRCNAPPTTSLRVPMAPRPGCCGPNAVTAPAVVAVPPVTATAPPAVRFAAPLPPAPPPGTPPAAGPWQPPPGLQPHVTETRPVPGTSPKLLPPEDSNGTRLGPMPPADNEPPLVMPDPSRQADASAFPADIPQYNLVYDGVADGLQPLAGGWDWLKEHGFRTVLHIRAADEDASALRAPIEARGLKYVPLQVEPKTLNRDLVQEFSRLVRNSADQPLFVFDRKGMLAGSLWYLHFRLTDNLPEPQARARALRLGLKEETTGEYADLWLAINQILRGI